MSRNLYRLTNEKEEEEEKEKEEGGGGGGGERGGGKLHFDVFLLNNNNNNINNNSSGDITRLYKNGIHREKLIVVLDDDDEENGGEGEKSKKNFFNKKRTKYYKYLFFFTGILAFVFGFLLGTMLPTILVKNGDKNINNNNNTSPYGKKNMMAAASAVTMMRENYKTYQSVSDVIEGALPSGYTENDVNEWRKFTRNTTVVQIKEGCGRMQNRLLKFSDGTISCCRYRRNTDQIQGELFSYYLGLTLGLRNLVPTTLGLVKMRDTKWSSVRSEMMYAQWVEDKPVVLTKFVPNLITAFIPFNFRNSNRRLHPTDVSYNTSQVTGDILDNLVELAQWSDMIIFDYLTANLDRVVNNLYNLQWNFAMMDAPTHNLRRTIHDKLLIFLDNESGLLHGYRLLDKYESYHSALLNSLCVFRKSTAEIIKNLWKNGNVGDILLNKFNENEPDFKDYLPSLPEKSIQILNERITKVYNIIEKCESLYSSHNNDNDNNNNNNNNNNNKPPDGG
ncbi:conserved hypothetical protein [Pediculus humanus corporis]|uniref:Protein four-jointed n=1 Tax=Pediculus humanus subsp. corporis TaxID=121224 RepID=E0W2R2_PEDHC|nr:uncharacterized protein Phum_PHUM596540 [Pediculus humanus corporis]EEB19918.1 conserved hypothetical protein [Pediculus humanus corporis]